MPDAVAPAPVAPNGATQATPSPSAATTTSTTDDAFEVKVGGELKKYTKAEAIRLLSRRGYDEQVLQQSKEAQRQLADMREATEREKKERGSRLATDPEGFFKEHGGDWEAAVRAHVERRVAAQQLTPEQKEAETAKAEAARLKKELEERDAKESKAKLNEAAKVIQQRIESQLAEAAERAGMPKDADSFHAIYEALKEWRRLGLPWDADRVVETAKENVEGGFKRLEQSVLKGLKGQALEDRLGKSVVDAIIQHRIEKLRGGGAMKTSTPIQGATSSTRPPAQAIESPSDYLARMRGGR